MECEVTFRKRFQIREDQNPADIGRMYIETMGFEVIDTRVLYDPTFGDDVECECGHAYYRHFDTYEDMAPVGCKYCMHGDMTVETQVCSGFKRKRQ